MNQQDLLSVFLLSPKVQPENSPNQAADINLATLLLLGATMRRDSQGSFLYVNGKFLSFVPTGDTTVRVHERGLKYCLETGNS